MLILPELHGREEKRFYNIGVSTTVEKPEPETGNEKQEAKAEPEAEVKGEPEAKGEAGPEVTAEPEAKGEAGPEVKTEPAEIKTEIKEEVKEEKPIRIKQ
jgi:hypothetical protein